MKVTFIKPNIGRIQNKPFVDKGMMEPLQLGVLAALTDRDVDVEFYDDRVEEINFDNPTDLAAITVETHTAKRSYEISEEFRKRGIPVIMGGMHPTLIPQEATQNAESIYIGDAEFLWKKVVTDLKNKKLKKIYKALVGIPQPGILTRRDIFKGKNYLPITLLQFGRGCKYQCNFCAVSRYFHNKHYFRKIDEILQEIEDQGRKFLFFVDDNIVSDYDAAKTLFQELIPLKIKWVSQASIDFTNDLKLTDLMVRSGCLGNVVGFESILPQSIKEMNKGPNFLIEGGGYKRALKVLRDYGLQTWAAFLLGNDHDTKDSIKRTLDFAMENKFAFAAFNILMPYPNTKLYDRLKKENRLLYDGKWWLHPKYKFNHASFVPMNMTPDELTEISFYCRKNFNSTGSIIKRMFDFNTNMGSLYRLGIYLLYNFLVRKEIRKKQNIQFGLK
jgi:radical SAM superfamily enzyme YgiQ (UPF0313 family)